MRDFRLKTSSGDVVFTNPTKKEKDKPKEKRGTFPVVACRVPQAVRDKLSKMYRNHGELSRALTKLITDHVGLCLV